MLNEAIDKLVIGITGGIGSGKSAVSEYLINIGEHVISADSVSRNVVKPGNQGNVEIKRVFGDSFFLKSGELDRKKLAEYVFSDEEKLNILNNLLHPIIINEIFKEAERLEGRVFIEVPLLIQTGMHEKVDYVWLVTADIETRIKRTIARDGASKEHILRRMGNQMSDNEMSLVSDEIIENSGSIEELHKKIDIILKKPEYSR